MASSPPNSTDDAATSAGGTAIEFALQELTACWQQAYEAISRGELDVATALMDVADQHVMAAGDGSRDGPAEADLRRRAATTFGLLQHAMTTGMQAIEAELGRARHGAKALRGYDHAGSVGRRIQHDA